MQQQAAKEQQSKSAVDSAHVPTCVNTCNQRRVLNLGLVLKRFCPLSPVELVERLQKPEAAVKMQGDHLANLLKHFPTDDEVELGHFWIS
jgi:hypothetical protein